MAENRHECPGSCGYHSLMTVMDTRSCPVILLDPCRVHPTGWRRGARRRRRPAPVGLPGRHPRPARAQWAAASADCDPGHGRRGGADRRSFLRRDRRVGRGCPTAGAGGTGRLVLAQHQVDGAPGEVPGFQPLLAGLELTGAVVTADALHTTREAAEFLVTVKHADYLFTVKANRPALLERCQRLAWHQVPVLDRTRDQAHGRVEIRTLKAVSVRGFGFPHTKQVIQVTRKVRDLGSRRWRTTTAYAVTSLVHAQASPARLADYLRGHWSIEALHQVRDTTFAEDTSQVRTGSAPQVMAALRNLAIGVLCRAGPVNLAAALRHHSRNPLPTLGRSRHQHRMNRTSRG
ncbi:MAG TPA: ISAs1 family transposase [Propionibacteriaceae bacterium]|nr:ISAs1 family transposase [Propionibacteriaceae bacterium]